jgi:hypothetical protein
MTFREMHLATPLAVLAAVLMVGCSGEPSSSEVKALVEREIKPALEMQAMIMKNAGALGGGKAGQGTPTLSDVKKVGCKADGESAYRCDIELVVVNGAESKSQVVPMRFVKASSGWQVTQ